MKIIRFIIILINVALLGGQFLLANSLSESGAELNRLSTQASQTLEQNRQFEKLIYQFSSVDSIRSRADAAGLVGLELTSVSPPAVARRP